METIEVVVDGFVDRIPVGTSISQLIARHRAQHKDLVVELDGRFVYPADYEATFPSHGARVEFIHPAFGG
ncbi:MAG: MoaD/ThiS family protein [Desulfarculus sp.]|jgi:sulfur carrier protein ThiS|nr:MoaD/ThiS family protein [Desulfarculus sp.]